MGLGVGGGRLKRYVEEDLEIAPKETDEEESPDLEWTIRGKFRVDCVRVDTLLPVTSDIKLLHLYFSFSVLAVIAVN